MHVSMYVTYICALHVHACVYDYICVFMYLQLVYRGMLHKGQEKNKKADKEAKIKKLINHKREMKGMWRKSEKQLRIETEEAKKVKTKMEKCLD